MSGRHVERIDYRCESSFQFCKKNVSKSQLHLQTLTFFVKDQVKKFVVNLVIVCPLIAAIVAIVQWGGDYFFVYTWLFLAVFVLFMMTIYPTFIAPLFDTYEPLEGGELRTKIEALAARLKFPLTKIYVVDGSKRSSHSNAYLYGFWRNKRIVLYDTLIADYVMKNKTKEETDKPPQEENKDKHEAEGCENDEIVAVLGHELGHWSLWHVASSLVIVQVRLFFVMT